ncbi:hypothetical protein BSR29_02200 [Boudabousia liubingyangii]|uniref:Polymerase/histidinol phosphatase N-terminal domain-containing protein n=1 Tax=Boudabousia liubingyangii TaxID=1921764 RepID=A0A1Q5PQA4_9ACTO|nr:PHP domain-containing protein [Boudabousia liubingyangii]OKL49781.1 hypothetical protein BSR29_02200 [Boudabousia liubingyangii]
MSTSSAPKIDLHTHSRVSDGTDTPTELIAAAVEAGLSTIALTDHDTTRGWDEAQQAADAAGLDILLGTEVSTRLEGHSIHMLAFGAPAKGALAEIYERTRESREGRMKAMAEKLAEDFPITYEDVLSHCGPGATLGRPHLADALVAAGCFPDRTAAFNGPLRPDSPYYVGHWAPSPVEAIEAIRSVGGVPVVAHALSKTRDFSPNPEQLEEMFSYGMAGMECYHRDHSAAAQDWILKFCEKHGRFVTGGSDYHGTGKPNRLGENVTDPQVLVEIRRMITAESL